MTILEAINNRTELQQPTPLNIVGVKPDNETTRQLVKEILESQNEPYTLSYSYDDIVEGVSLNPIVIDKDLPADETFICKKPIGVTDISNDDADAYDYLTATIMKRAKWSLPIGKYSRIELEAANIEEGQKVVCKIYR